MLPTFDPTATHEPRAYDYTYYNDGKLKEFRDVNDQVGKAQWAN